MRDLFQQHALNDASGSSHAKDHGWLSHWLTGAKYPCDGVIHFLGGRKAVQDKALQRQTSTNQRDPLAGVAVCRCVEQVLQGLGEKKFQGYAGPKGGLPGLSVVELVKLQTYNPEDIADTQGTNTLTQLGL
jgi:hypothetical protein